MFCINCGGQNVDITTDKDKKVFVERGEYQEGSGNYSREFEAVVLECSECHHEMINAS